MKLYYTIQNSESIPRITGYLNSIEDRYDVYINFIHGKPTTDLSVEVSKGRAEERIDKSNLLIEGHKQDATLAREDIKWHEEMYCKLENFFEKAHDDDVTEEIYEKMVDNAKRCCGYQEFDVSSFSIDSIKQTIGRDGCFFITVTEMYGLNSIWHNKERNVIEFWGDYYSINKSKLAIIKKLNWHNKGPRYHFKHLNSEINHLCVV